MYWKIRTGKILWLIHAQFQNPGYFVVFTLVSKKSDILEIRSSWLLPSGKSSVDDWRDGGFDTKNSTHIGYCSWSCLPRVWSWVPDKPYPPPYWLLLGLVLTPEQCWEPGTYMTMWHSVILNASGIQHNQRNPFLCFIYLALMRQTNLIPDVSLNSEYNYQWEVSTNLHAIPK